MDVLSQRWFPHEDDLIGGWCVMTADTPPSLARHELGQVEVGNFLGEDVARHVAELHNAALSGEA